MTIDEGAGHEVTFFYLALIQVLKVCFVSSLCLSGDRRQHSEPVTAVNTSSLTRHTAALGSLRGKPLTDGDRCSPRMKPHRGLL